MFRVAFLFMNRLNKTESAIFNFYGVSGGPFFSQTLFVTGRRIFYRMARMRLSIGFRSVLVCEKNMELFAFAAF